MGVERVSEVAMVTEGREGGKEGGARKRRKGRMEGKCPLIKCCTVFFQFCGMHSPRAVNGDSIQLLRGEQLRRPVGGGERGHVQPSLARLGRHVSPATRPAQLHILAQTRANVYSLICLSKTAPRSRSLRLFATEPLPSIYTRRRAQILINP